MTRSWWRRTAAAAWKYAGADSQAIAAAVRAAALWGVDGADDPDDASQAAERRASPRLRDQPET